MNQLVRIVASPTLPALVAAFGERTSIRLVEFLHALQSQAISGARVANATTRGIGLSPFS
jgi:hypothetical protein